MQISETTKKAIINHAQAVAPNECCGFLVSDDMDGLVFYYTCQNQASDPQNYFEISSDDWIEAEKMGEIIAIVHSHPNGEPKLSLADRQLQDLLGLDFILAAPPFIKAARRDTPPFIKGAGGIFDLHFFPKIPPLIGREFIHSKADCYTIFKDFYYLSGADLPDYYREDDWWEKGQNLYLANMERYGFKRLENGENLQIGDVILMQVGANVPNHAGIYIGNQMVLHHSPKRLSKRDLYDGYWLKHTHSIWRLNEWQRSQLDFTVALRHLDRVSSSM